MAQINALNYSKTSATFKMLSDISKYKIKQIIFSQLLPEVLGLDFNFNDLDLKYAAKKTSWNCNPSVKITNEISNSFN
ncbi:hypothetical protein BpHYR1_003234 [Brachionus plicatilis]|uniref:Uncharacterized protein n=1 Tax=Brachionus plicatilis TaxID=10195 RepID=A0A3M7SEZ1_BRAPC|nr:hypothetical protein BpHYR1_003234 [Brachionus plicatilis]